MRIAIESAAPEAPVLAALFENEGADVQIADDPSDCTPDIAYLDVWTAEVDDRVRRLRARGTRLTCLSDLLLERTRLTTVGVTGTAGKSTTTAFVTQILRSAGITTYASTTARLGNRWATEELLPTIGVDPPGVLVLELTSSHLAFCATSPSIAIVTSFWADHIELHGSMAAYRRAKETIVRHQSANSHVIVDADDPVVASFADATPALRWEISTRREVERGLASLDGVVIAGTDDGRSELGLLDATGPRLRATLLAAAAALAAGASRSAVATALPRLEVPPHRAATIGRLGATALVDDSMAATPTKAAVTLDAYPDSSVVVVIGGELESAGRPVHASPEEHALLDNAAAVVRRVARYVVPFGPAGPSVADRVGRGETCAPTLELAISRALELADGAAAVVVTPMFPVLREERECVPGWLHARHKP